MTEPIRSTLWFGSKQWGNNFYNTLIGLAGPINPRNKRYQGMTFKSKRYTITNRWCWQISPILLTCKATCYTKVMHVNRQALLLSAIMNHLPCSLQQIMSHTIHQTYSNLWWLQPTVTVFPHVFFVNRLVFIPSWIENRPHEAHGISCLLSRILMSDSHDSASLC